jgi:hypothetical protein
MSVVERVKTGGGLRKRPRCLTGKNDRAAFPRHDQSSHPIGARENIDTTRGTGGAIKPEKARIPMKSGDAIKNGRDKKSGAPLIEGERARCDSAPRVPIPGPTLANPIFYLVSVILRLRVRRAG